MRQIIKAIWKSNEVPTNEYFLWLKYEEGGFILLAETTNSSNKKERHLLIGDTDTQYHSLMVTVDMNLVPGSQVGPTASIDRPASIYIDDVYAYIQMSVVQSLTDYTMLSFLNS